MAERKETVICPFTRGAGGVSDCVRQKCALWNNHFGVCSFAVYGRLKSIESHKQELQMLRHEV